MQATQIHKPQAIIKAENVHFSYEDGTKALCGISLELKRGQKIAFMGANGSGKSTFFLCLNGILKPQSGTIYYKGLPISYKRKDLLFLRSKIGIIFQDPDNQLFSTNVYQEISFGALNIGMSKEAAKKAVEELIDLLEITPFAKRPVHALSGGQKKQVAIADVLIMSPEVVILDEPAAALDPKHASILNSMIDKMTQRGITVILSTHDANHALEWADEIVLFQNGTVLMQGSPESVFSNQTALTATNLEQPALLQIFDRLCQKGILSPKLSLPKNFKTLEAYIEQLKPANYLGGCQMETNSKKAILVVSFGTTYAGTRKKTITKIEEEVAAAYPDYKIYHAFTSKMIIKKLLQRDRLKVPTVSEAMELMAADHITDLIVQPTHIINGIENDLMKEDVLKFQSEFHQICFGSPLLTTSSDNKQVILALMEEFPDLASDEALVFMGHGTTHYANAVYAALDYTFKELGYSNVFIGTVEAYPSMDTLLKLVTKFQPKHVILAPFMVVAGEHAANDMAGDNPDSWRCRFEQAGFSVSCVMKGLGEYPGIRSLYLNHIAELLPAASPE